MEDNENRKMRITRRVKAPLKLVWEICSKPEHMTKWWGPKGYTNSIHKLEFEKDGNWEMTMHDPNGTDYHYKSKFKEIIPYKKIEYEHFDPHFVATILFESQDEYTLIDWSMVFETEELRTWVIENYRADVGQTQNMDRLEAYITEVFRKIQS